MTLDPASLLRLSRSFYLIIAVFYMGGIYFLSSLSIPFEDVRHPNLLAFCANLFHFPLYMGLGIVLLLGFRGEVSGEGPWIVPRTIFISMTVLALYGAFDEVHQSWSGRTPSVMDFLVNLCGGLCALWSLKFLLDRSITRTKLFRLATGMIVLACIFAFAGMF
jgi:VanZ family protein